MQRRWHNSDDPGTEYLHEGSFHRGLGKFHPTPYREPFELPDKTYPFILSTGRALFHFHSGTMSRHSHGLDEIQPEAEVEINSQDAERFNCSDGDLIEVASRRGKIRANPQGDLSVTLGVGFHHLPFQRSTSQSTDP